MNNDQRIYQQRDLYGKEKKRLVICRCIHAVILLALLLSPAWYSCCRSINRQNKPQLPELKLVSKEVNLVGQYESYENVIIYKYQVVMTFNQPVSTGTVSVAFYDKNEILLETEKVNLSYPQNSPGQSVVQGTTSLDSKAASYELKNHTIEPYKDPNENLADWTFFGIYSGFLFLLLCTTKLWIRNFTCNCQEYTVGDHRILVYAGHKIYLKVDGRKYDEAVREHFFSRVWHMHTLLEDGNILDVTVTRTLKQIKLKVNDRLTFPD